MALSFGPALTLDSKISKNMLSRSFILRHRTGSCRPSVEAQVYACGCESYNMQMIKGGCQGYVAMILAGHVHTVTSHGDSDGGPTV